jgi:hypothetical protein
MARGEYGPAFVGNGTRLPEATGIYQSYAVVFRERVNELDAAIQQADRDYAAKYQTDWRAADQKPGEGLDQAHFVFTYWLPFVRAWNVARTQLLAGRLDRTAALVLLSWAGRFNDLKRDAGASWGLDTTAPSVTIRGTVDERGKYGTSRVGDDASQARKVRDISHAIEPRSAFYNPDAFDPKTQPKVEIGTKGTVVLIAALAAIIGIGVVGTKRGVKWM